MLKTNKRGGNTIDKIFNILCKFHPCNISSKLKLLKGAKQNYFVSFQIVEEVPKLIYEGSENKTIPDLHTCPESSKS